MRRLAPLALVLPVLVAVALVAAGGAGAAKTPKLPKVPKVTSYGATLDISGSVDVTFDWDSTNPCAPGTAYTAVQHLDVELGRPLPITVRVVNGHVVSSLTSKTAGVSLTTEIKNYRESNNCPPYEKDPHPSPKPVCTPRITGRLSAALVDGPSLTNKRADDDELVPLSSPVGILLGRMSGPLQLQTCKPIDQDLRPRSGDARLDTMRNRGNFQLPLRFTNTQLMRLKLGKQLTDTVRVGGACNTFLVNPSPTRATIAAKPEDCTVKAAILVMVKRTVQ